MVVVAVLSAVLAIVIPGYQTWLLLVGGLLAGWAIFSLLTEE